MKSELAIENGRRSESKSRNWSINDYYRTEIEREREMLLFSEYINRSVKGETSD